MDNRQGSAGHLFSGATCRGWMRFLFGVLRIACVVINNLYCIPVHLVWLLLLQPLRLLAPGLYWRIEGIFFRWLLSMVAAWSYSAGYDIIERGDDVWQMSNDRTLVLYNHQSTSDVPLIMAAFNCRPNFSDSVMWIMDRVFRMTNFGIVSVTHGDFFIRAGKRYRDSSLLSLRQHLTSFYQPIRRKWIVLFPEGGFLVNRMPSSQRYGQKLGLPHLQHVSLPRVGALKVILDHAAAHPQDGVRWVVDVTVGYPGGHPLNLQTLITGWRPPCTTVLHYRCYTADKIPRDEKGLGAWVNERYVEKERMLAEYYATGVFPDAPSPAYPSPAPLPPHVKIDPVVGYRTRPPQAEVGVVTECSSATLVKGGPSLPVANSVSGSGWDQHSGGVDLEIISAGCSDGCYGNVSEVKSKDVIVVDVARSNSKCQSNDTPKNNDIVSVSDVGSTSNLKVTSSSCISSISSSSSNCVNLSELNIVNVGDSKSIQSTTCSSSIVTNGEDAALECLGGTDSINNNSPKHCISPLVLSSSNTTTADSRLSNSLGTCNSFNNISSVGLSTSLTTDETSSQAKSRSEGAVAPLYPETHRPQLARLPGIRLKHDPIEFTLRHLFYMMSTYIACTAFSYGFTAALSFCC